MKQLFFGLIGLAIVVGLFGWVFPPMVSSSSTFLVLFGLVGAVLTIVAGFNLVFICVKSYLKGKEKNA